MTPKNQQVAGVEFAERVEEFAQPFFGDDSCKRIPERAALVALADIAGENLVGGRAASQPASLLITSCDDEIRQITIEDLRSVANEQVVKRVGSVARRSSE